MLVTHQLQYLSDVEHSVLMNNGRIEAQGSFKLLQQSKKHLLLLNECVETNDVDVDTDRQQQIDETNIKEMVS